MLDLNPFRGFDTFLTSVGRLSMYPGLFLTRSERQFWTNPSMAAAGGREASPSSSCSLSSEMLETVRRDKPYAIVVND